MYVILIEADEEILSSKNLYFVEQRYSNVWDTEVKRAKKFKSKVEVDSFIKENWFPEKIKIDQI